MDNNTTNSNKNPAVAVLISFLILGLYYFLNTFVIKNMNEIPNYIFLGLAFIAIYITVSKLYMGKYILYNRDYLKRLDTLRFLGYFFGYGASYRRYAYTASDSLIKEGNLYVDTSKTLFILIRIGMILLVTFLWYIICFNNTIFSANHDMFAILIGAGAVIVSFFLAGSPVMVSMHAVNKKTDEIIKRNNEKRKNNQ